jgi:hypothetical protein
MGTPADRLNRILLSLLGLLLLAGGVAGILAGTGVLGADVPDRRVLSGEFVDLVRENATWLWPAAALVGVLLALLALRWLLGQLRTDRIDELDLTDERNVGEVRLQAGALTDAVVDAVEDCPGVDSASARLIRRKRRETLLVHVRLADRADLAAARRTLAEGPLADLRSALGGTDWPAVVVELEPSRKGDARAVA